MWATRSALSGWVHKKRDHGGVLFVDLRDHYGITQIVADEDSAALPMLEGLRLESVVTIDGEVKARSEGDRKRQPFDRARSRFLPAPRPCKAGRKNCR